MSETVYYEASGSVCGSCGHKHRTIEAAQRCADNHGAAIRRKYPSTFPCRAYSDRAVKRCDGEPLTEREIEELDDVLMRR